MVALDQRQLLSVLQLEEAEGDHMADTPSTAGVIFGRAGDGIHDADEDGIVDVVDAVGRRKGRGRESQLGVCLKRGWTGIDAEGRVVITQACDLDVEGLGGDVDDHVIQEAGLEGHNVLTRETLQQTCQLVKGHCLVVLQI